MKTWLAVLVFCPSLSIAQAWHIDARAGAAYTQTHSDVVFGDKPALTWRADLAVRRTTKKSFEYGLGVVVQPLVTIIKRESGMFSGPAGDVRVYFANPAFTFNGFIGDYTVAGKNSLGVGFGAGYCLVPETGTSSASNSTTANYGPGAKGWLVSFYLRDDYKVGKKVSLSAAIQPGYHSLKSENIGGYVDELTGYSVPLTLGISVEI
jgi:hypothetical protein